MNRLIDALLKFSSMAHVEPRREMVDLAAMAHEVAEELKLAEPERQVTFRIPERNSGRGRSGFAASGPGQPFRQRLEVHQQS